MKNFAKVTGKHLCQSLYRTPPVAAFEANSVVYEKHESFQTHPQSNFNLVLLQWKYALETRLGSFRIYFMEGPVELIKSKMWWQKSWVQYYISYGLYSSITLLLYCQLMQIWINWILNLRRISSNLVKYFVQLSMNQKRLPWFFAEFWGNAMFFWAIENIHLHFFIYRNEKKNLLNNSK